MERKSVPRSVAGAITCRRRNLAGPACLEAATLPCSSSAVPMDRTGRELRQHVTSVAKPYELRAALTSRCEESLRW
jgi:hypothetical protein